MFWNPKDKQILKLSLDLHLVFRETFEVDIEGFTPVKVLVATTVFEIVKLCVVCLLLFL